MRLFLFGAFLGTIVGISGVFCLSPVVQAQTVARYNLSQPERDIAISWLFKEQGYLDVAIRSGGQSARQALALDPGLDVAIWIRDNIRDVAVDQRDWEACGMVWWIWKHDNVNANKPPESAAWVVILQDWAASIDRAFLRVSDVARNANTVDITAQDGTVSTMPAGTQLIHQRSMFTKVIGELQ